MQDAGCRSFDAGAREATERLPEPLSFDSELHAVLSAPAGTDPLAVAAEQRIYRHWVAMCDSKRVGCPPWKLVREPVIRAVVATHRLAAEKFGAEQAFEPAMQKLELALSLTAQTDRRAGCGERIGESAELWGTRHNWEEKLGTLLGRANGSTTAPDDGRRGEGFH